MSADHRHPAVGPCCPRRPNLREILDNTAQPPWTLTAFMAYLSSNHCLETLEFTMDAGRYRKHYAKMLSRSGVAAPTSPTRDSEYVRDLWRRLVDAYIRPSGSREVNLPSTVRDPILRAPADTFPPSPDTLDPAVAKIYELMEDSVLVPFLNSVYPQSPDPVAPPTVHPAAYEDRSAFSRHSHRGRDSPSPPHSHSERPSSRSNRHPNTSSSGNGGSHMPVRPLDRLNSFWGTRSSPTPSDPGSDMCQPMSTNGSAGPGLTTDNESAGSGRDEFVSTPPGTAAMLVPTTSSGSHSPTSDFAGSPKRDSGMWRKLGRFGNMKASRKKSHGALDEER